jgi:Dyp-type peroxidase family
MAASKLRLDNIQGNSLGGFNKDFEDFLFLTVKDKEAARKWVREATQEFFSSAEHVLAFNNAFKALKDSGVKKPESVIQARWANIAFTFAGMEALGVSADAGDLGEAFKKGMAARSGLLGDAGASDPKNWTEPFRPAEVEKIHVLIIVAADSASDLVAHVAAVQSAPGFSTAFGVVGRVAGRTRVDQVGHEHFGFKDGVSQPGIRGITTPDDPIANPEQGHPGQDLLWPGEFVLGYPKQIDKADPDVDGPNPHPGPLSKAGNASWTNDGSFLVFRRLAQDVGAFHEQLAALAKAQSLSVDLMGAKLVGRYRSGCPLEALSMQPKAAPPSPTDPGIPDPSLANNDALNNAFEFGNDAKGTRCPVSAHIRKAYPRDEDTGAGPDSESATQTRRLLRRGIPFGRSWGSEDHAANAESRGLLFLAYQNDIEQHFEFVQSKWVNRGDFPPLPLPATHGEDPIIATSSQGKFELSSGHPIAINHFVTTTGGAYFFVPSIHTLSKF